MEGLRLRSVGQKLGLVASVKPVSGVMLGLGVT